MIVILALFCLWGCDNQSYDADMEKQFTAETGHTWKEVERAVR